MDTGTHFTDTEGRRWSFEVNVFTVQRVQRETGVNLLGLTDLAGDTLQRLATDVVALFDVMASLLQDQLKDRDISVEGFGRALDERAVGDATKALVTAVLDFFQPAKAETLKTVFAKVWTASERASSSATTRVAELMEGPEFDAAIEEAVAAVFAPAPAVPGGPGEESSS